VVKARGSFHLEDFEIRSPGDKQPIERSEAGGGGRDRDEKEPKRRRRRKRGLGSPAEIEALLAEEEAASVLNPEAMADDGEDEGEAAAEASANGQIAPAPPASGEPAIEPPPAPPEPPKPSE
jgi:hypothetical protein